MARAGLIALGVLVLAAQAHGGTGARASRTDWTFMRAAAALDRASIASGKLAASQAAARPLRAFGTELVQQHEAILRELSLLTLVNQVPLPSRIDAKERRLLAGLKAKHGAEFDRACDQHIAGLQQQAVTLFQHEVDASAADPALRSFARTFLPKLRLELHAARALAGPADAPH
jgi:predicted outer membrane protein